MAYDRRLPALFVVAVLAGCTTVQAGSPNAVDRLDGNAVSFGKWTIGCGNLRSCTAIAPLVGHGGESGPHFVQMTASGNFSDAQGFAINSSEQVVVLTPQAGAALVRALLANDGLEAMPVAGSGGDHYVPRDGFAEALKALETWRIALPATARATETVTPLPAVPLDSPIPQFKPPGGGRACPAASMGQSLQAWRGFGGQVLWRAGCGNEGLNSTSYWYFAGPQGAPPTEIQFEDRQGPVTLYNSWFSADRGYLYSVHYFGHFEGLTEDCGIYRSYAWDFQGMKLAEQREMPQCGIGIGPEDWIVTYRATVLGGPDSGP